MAQNLDPNSEGRGVMQFKTGLMSVIKVFPTLSYVFFVCLGRKKGTITCYRVLHLYFLLCTMTVQALSLIIRDCKQRFVCFTAFIFVKNVVCMVGMKVL